ncbi:uncharacterized protein LOC127379358 [Dicentrarchus labrax]|uniref:uncharacterized protein LOC127379358 n=1 Tax=Dicentrarchus labrax TaxID=13489 RepID=UPI0021F68205|nr:uncharacterized protein LOC127379358 [Dicentrarchus labrax]
MLKFPTELIVHKGKVSSLLSVVGGLLMTVTAGSRCLDVALRTAQNPANLLRLSNTLIGLMGLRYQMHANSMAKRKLKRLYFTDSFNSLFDIIRTTLLQTPDLKVLCWFPASPEQQTNLESTFAHCISARRCRIYYILICGVSSQPVLTLCMGNNGSKLKTYNPSNQLQWFINFTSKTKGDVIFLLLGGHTGEICAGSATNSATNEPTSLTLGFSVLSVVLLWMFLPHIAVCALIYLGWKVKQHSHRVLQSLICSS